MTSLRSSHNKSPLFHRSDYNTPPFEPLHEKLPGYITTYDKNFKSPSKDFILTQFMKLKHASSMNRKLGKEDHILRSKLGLLGY